MAQWASAFWKRACSCRSWRATCGACAFLADACAGAQRLCGAGRARAAAPAAHRRQRRGRRAVRGLRACTKPSAGGAGLRAYGPLRQPAVAGRDHSCVPAHPLRGAAMFALLSAGGDVGASLGAFCVGRAADWAQASGTVFAGAAGNLGRCARACCWRRCSRCCAAACTRRCIAPKRGAAYPQGANGGTGNRRKLFFKPEPPFADGAKDRKMNKRRGLHGRAVCVLGGQPQSGERDAVSGSTNWDLAL